MAWVRIPPLSINFFGVWFLLDTEVYKLYIPIHSFKLSIVILYINLLHHYYVMIQAWASVIPTSLCFRNKILHLFIEKASYLSVSCINVSRVVSMMKHFVTDDTVSNVLYFYLILIQIKQRCFVHDANSKMALK